MVIELQRWYRDGWTDGLIFIKGILLCRSIELRWANNERNVSCVPEGVYPVAIIQHPKFGECLQVSGVKGRSGILVHVANDAQKELRGCIAPVFSLSNLRPSSFQLKNDTLAAVALSMRGSSACLSPPALSVE